MLVRLLISIWKDSTCKAQKPCDLYLSFSSLSQAPHPLQGTYYRAGSSTLYTFSLLLFSSCLCFFCFSTQPVFAVRADHCHFLIFYRLSLQVDDRLQYSCQFRCVVGVLGGLRVLLQRLLQQLEGVVLRVGKAMAVRTWRARLSNM